MKTWATAFLVGFSAAAGAVVHSRYVLAYAGRYLQALNRILHER